MLGAIVGDIIGSVYEFASFKFVDFPLFSDHSDYTDDTILSCATAKVLMDGGSYADTYANFALRYPDGGYGARFSQWFSSVDRKPYGSFGNGAAMRIGPVGWAFDSEDSVLMEAKRSSECTHDHPEGIKGAQAIALAIFMARCGRSKKQIKERIERGFGYDLSRTTDDIRPEYLFDETCQGTVPEAIICFLEAKDYEDSIRNAVSLGGDADTLACITGGISEAFYGGVPEDIADNALQLLPMEFVEIIVRFEEKYINRKR